MFETSGTNDEGRGASPPPPAADRLWRHPSEMAAQSAAPSPDTSRPAHRPHRFSLGTVVVAGSLGALAMFGTLASMGLIDGRTARITTDTTGSPLAETAVDSSSRLATALPDGVVSVRLTGTDTTTFGAGIVLDGTGDVVTTLRSTADDGTTLGALAIDVGNSTWTDAVVVGTDAVTGLSVLQPRRLRSARTSATTVGARVAPPSLGQSVAMVRPGLDAVGAQYRGAADTRITSTNAWVSDGGATSVGLLVLTSTRPASTRDIGIDDSTGAVTALVVPLDDNTEDEMVYALPADLAVRVGHQIETSGHARHGALAATLAPSSRDTLVVTQASMATAVSGADQLAPGDEVISVDGRTVHRRTDVEGALLAIGDDATVSVVVRRANQLRPMEVPVVPAQAELASTTTLP